MKFKYYFLIVIVFIISIAVSAEYTKSYRTKRVISATASDGILFSSNYLKEDSGELNFATIYINHAEAQDLTVDYFNTVITIANYAQGNPTRYYRREINYTLTTSIVKLLTSNSVQTVTSNLPLIKIDNAPLQASYNGTLSGGATENEYALSLPRSMLTSEKLYLQLIATPIGDTYTDLAPIKALIELAVQPEASSATWEITPVDNRSNDIGEYTGYNFRLFGSGRGTITLGWDNNLFELNQIFVSNVGATTCASPWNNLSAVIFNVDAVNINSYDIQLYPRGELPNNWNNVDIKIIFNEDL